MKKKTLALTATGAVLVGLVGTGVGFAVAPASADGPERHAHGWVGGAEYEIDIEKERRFEIDADLDGVPAGSTWRMVVRHDGQRVATRTARAVYDDGRYEVDFGEVRRVDSAGRDRFKVTLQRVGSPTKVTRVLTFAR